MYVFLTPSFCRISVQRLLLLVILSNTGLTEAAALINRRIFKVLKMPTLVANKACFAKEDRSMFVDLTGAYFLR